MAKRILSFSTEPGDLSDIDLSFECEDGSKETVSVPGDIIPLLAGHLIAETQNVGDGGDMDKEGDAKNALRVETVQFGTAHADGSAHVALRFKVQGGLNLLTILPRQGATKLAKELDKHARNL